MCLCSKKNKIKWRSWAWTPLPEGRVMGSDPAGPKDTHTQIHKTKLPHILFYSSNFALQLAATEQSVWLVHRETHPYRGPLMWDLDITNLHSSIQIPTIIKETEVWGYAGRGCAYENEHVVLELIYGYIFIEATTQSLALIYWKKLIVWQYGTVTLSVWCLRLRFLHKQSYIWKINTIQIKMDFDSIQ